MHKGVSQFNAEQALISADDRLRRLAEFSLTLTGEPATVFRRIAEIIGEMLSVRVVCLSEIRGEELYFISVYLDGEVILDAGHCPLNITPCATVAQSRDLRIYDKVMELFPDATFLKDHNAHSYCGFPALDANGDVIAVTCLLDDKPHEFSDDDQALLQIFGQRIAFELDRARQQASQAETEQALMKREKHYRHLVETAHAIPWTFDLRAGVFTYVGPQAEELLGYPVERWYEKDFWQKHIIDEDRDWAVDYCMTHAGRCEDHDFEYRMLAANGSIVWIRDSVNVLADKNGPYKMHGFMFDVTERKDVEAALNSLAEIDAGNDIEVFYKGCVENLANVYGCQYAFIGLLADKEATRVQTQAVWAGKDFADNFEYELEGTPCADILDQTIELVPRDAASKYPDDQMLVDMDVESYFGAPLFNADGKTIGLVSVLDTKPMELSRWVRPLLGMFAQRIAVEVQRDNVVKQLLCRDLRMQQQQQVLLLLSQKQPVIYEDHDKYLQLATKAASDCLGIARASIWLYEKNPNRIVCIDLYESANAGHSSGIELFEKDYPAYFKAMNEDRAIVAHDAHHSEETYEFSEGYLTPLGITSMLDAPIRIAGEMVGVLCCEHIGEQRSWELDEQNFASALADEISLSLELEKHKNTAIELSAHKEHLEELVEKRTETLRQQAQILDQIHDSVVVTNMGGIVTSWNAGAERLFGYAAGEAIGQHISFVHPSNQHENLINEVIYPLQEKGNHETEVIMKRKSGEEFHALLSLSMLYDDNAKPVGMVGYSLDITERKRYEALLIEAKKEADNANIAKSEFLSRMSHELRTPLNSILGFTSIVKSGRAGAVNDEQVQQLKRVFENGEHLLEMINDILDLAKIESGKMEITISQFDLSSELDNLVASLSAQAEAKGLGIKYTAQQQAEMVTSDRDKLWHVIQNILTNAVKYTKQGHISLAVQQQNNNIVISISDTGIGIKPDRIHDIFKAFEQADNASSREFTGVGLGLAICREYMKMLKGSISVESKYGEGSTFIVSLPRDFNAA